MNPSSFLLSLLMFYLCLVVPTTRTQVRLGEYDVRTDPDCQQGVCAPPVQDIDVEDYYCHSGYNTDALQDDICLIRLASPIQFNRKS